MQSDTLPIRLIGVVVFWLAAILYGLWFKMIEKTRRTVIVNNEKVVFKYSRQIIVATIMGCTILGYMYVVQFLEQGYYEREQGILIWWPRYVAYALGVATLMYTYSVFLWNKTKDKATNVILGFTCWIVSGLIASFSVDPYQWVHFGLGLLPLLSSLWILWCRRTREDNFAKLMLFSLVVIFLLFFGNWALSVPGSNTVDREITMWIYLVLEIITWVIVPYIILRLYIAKKDARLRTKKMQSHNINNIQHNNNMQYNGYMQNGNMDMFIN